MEQSALSIKTNETPTKCAVIAFQKAQFIENLRANGGNVSRALSSSGLARRTAYDHLRNDEAFADEWRNAQETALDELFNEARRRAVEGDVTEQGVRRSDALLIFLMKQGDIKKKWRARIIHAGNIAIESLRAAGRQHRLPEAVISDIEAQMLENFNAINLD